MGGFGGQALYTTRVTPGSGDALSRLSSSFSVFPEAWRAGSGISGLSVDYGAHIFKPQPNDFGLTQFLQGRFELM